jgi:glycopeptide antibiotics resistance protein
MQKSRFRELTEIKKNEAKMRWIFWCYLMALILISLLPLNSSDRKINHIFLLQVRLDHLLHGVLFLPWAILQYRCLQSRLILVLITGLVGAIFLESIQYVTTYRTFNINDLIGNLSGFLFGMALLYLTYQNVRRAGKTRERTIYD